MKPRQVKRIYVLEFYLRGEEEWVGISHDSPPFTLKQDALDRMRLLNENISKPILRRYRVTTFVRYEKRKA